MAKSSAVWGIDIGQTALKALRCRPHESEPRRIVADAFDYVEYSKILSQPEADRGELVAEAMAEFVKRNDLSGDRIAVSVPGQTGLARFIKLPPVESKKIPDIVKYEARQQIPFDLDDVVWDYQQLAGGSEEDGYILETEVGLFAMKRDQVTRSLEPFRDAGIGVDIIQLAPLSIYNFVCFDRLPELDAKKYDPDNPPKSVVVISLGTDTTDLVISNGYRVWQRNIPIGGNHFTKALSKELKLTFSKAEHLKRNATKAEDPKAVFQAMRPVFSDFLSEIQRSIGYFTSIDKKAKIGQVIALGNAMKLPGLLRYLSQNLEQKIQPIDQFNNLVGGSVTAGRQFKENVLGFAVPYGLCVQALEKAEIRTNLLPEEIVTERLVKGKKPWAVAAAAAVLVGTTVNFVAHYSQWETADLDKPEFQSVMTSAGDNTRVAGTYDARRTEIHGEFERMQTLGKNLVSNVEGRLLWLEVLRAVDAALPKDPQAENQEQLTGKALEEAIRQRRELHITKIDCEHFEDLSLWFGGVQTRYAADVAMSTVDASELAKKEKPPEPKPAPAADGTNADADGGSTDTAQPADDPANVDGGSDSATPDDAPVADDASATPADAVGSTDPLAGPEEAEDTGPTGPGWVIQLEGKHFHNGDDIPRDEQGSAFVRKTLLYNLREGGVELPVGPNGEMRRVSFKELGISYPVLIYNSRFEDITHNLLSQEDLWQMESEQGARRGRNGDDETKNGEAKEPEATTLNLKRYRFIVQFVWQPTPPTEREKKRQEQAEQNATLGPPI